MVDLSPEKFDYYTYDPIFLINMMSDMARIDFKLYKGAQAAGRLIFAVKDEFMISGMLMDFNRCMAVTVSSDAENSNPMYHSIRDLCTREMLLYRSTTMAENDRWKILCACNLGCKSEMGCRASNGTFSAG